MLQLEIPSRSVYVGVVRLAVASMGRLSGLDEERIDDLKIAVSEACANAVLAQPEDGGEALNVGWLQSDRRVTVEISGGGFAGDTSIHNEALGERMEMSVALLRSLVDECEFERTQSGGTIARLTVSL